MGWQAVINSEENDYYRPQVEACLERYYQRFPEQRGEHIATEELFLGFDLSAPCDPYMMPPLSCIICMDESKCIFTASAHPSYGGRLEDLAEFANFLDWERFEGRVGWERIFKNVTVTKKVTKQTYYRIS